MTLAITQNLMKEALLGSDVGATLSAELSDERRLFIYQNTIIGQLVDVLSSTYSSVYALVGEEYFGMLAQNFCRQFPPTEASLTYYGKEFPDYLKQQEALQAMPYIIDMANYEWAWNHTFFAENSEYLDPTSLLSLNEEEWENISFSVHPSVQLVKLDYPVHTLWQWVENGAIGDAPDLTKRSLYIMLRRNNEHEVISEELTKAESTFLNNIMVGQPVMQALKEIPVNSHGEWLEKLLMWSIVSTYKF